MYYTTCTRYDIWVQQDDGIFIILILVIPGVKNIIHTIHKKDILTNANGDLAEGYSSVKIIIILTISQYILITIKQLPLFNTTTENDLNLTL